MAPPGKHGPRGCKGKAEGEDTQTSVDAVAVLGSSHRKQHRKSRMPLAERAKDSGGERIPGRGTREGGATPRFTHQEDGIPETIRHLRTSEDEEDG